MRYIALCAAALGIALGVLEHFVGGYAPSFVFAGFGVWQLLDAGLLSVRLSSTRRVLPWVRWFDAPILATPWVAGSWTFWPRVEEANVFLVRFGIFAAVCFAYGIYVLTRMGPEGIQQMAKPLFGVWGSGSKEKSSDADRK